jgi:hypothetical protein
MTPFRRLLRRAIGRVFRLKKIDELRRVYPIGRDEFRYFEGDRSLDLQIDLLKGKPDRLLYPETIVQWRPPHQNEPIDAEKRAEIARTIAQFLNDTGESTEIFVAPGGSPAPTGADERKAP